MATLFLPHFSRQPSAAQYRDVRPCIRESDPSAEEEVCDTTGGVRCPHSELPGVLQEELPFFGEKQGEARKIDLLVIHLGLGEVGVDCDIEVQACRHAVLYVESDVAVGCVVRDPILCLTPPLSRHERLDTEIPPSVQGFEVAQPRQRS